MLKNGLGKRNKNGKKKKKKMLFQNLEKEELSNDSQILNQNSKI